MLLETQVALSKQQSELDHFAHKNLSDEGEASLSSSEREGCDISILEQNLALTKHTPPTSPGETIENAFIFKVSQNCVNKQVSNHPTVTGDMLKDP